MILTSFFVLSLMVVDSWQQAGEEVSQVNQPVYYVTGTGDPNILGNDEEHKPGKCASSKLGASRRGGSLAAWLLGCLAAWLLANLAVTLEFV